MIAMTNSESEEVSTELRCSACGGTGFPKVAQPAQPGRKIYPPPCKWCLGKGRVRSA
jgi:DnaJ-class molecular chaperone